jgi:hypothetical protein
VLALVGRLEARDWIDVITSCRGVQPLGYLAWAASGKDPGFSPAAVLEHAARTARYSVAEVEALSFSGEPPDPAELAREWRTMLVEAREVIAALPGDEVGTCVLDQDRVLFRAGLDRLAQARDAGELAFHKGTIGGALPSPIEQPPSCLSR